MLSQLLVTTPTGETKTLQLDNHRVSLGRASTNDLSFPSEPGLSRNHAAVEHEGDRWVLRDLGSRNGTFVNGNRVKGKHLLQSGDRVTAARLTLVYEELHQDPTPSGVIFESSDLSANKMTTQVTELKKILGAGPASTRVGPSGAGAWSSPITALIRAGRELAAPRPLAELFEIILDLASEAAGADRGVLMTLEEGELVVRAQHGQEFHISKAVRDRVLQEKLSLIIRDIGVDHEWQSHQSIVREGIRSLIAVPLQTDECVIGLLYLDSPGGGRRFHSQDLELLTVMANIAAIRIERERLAEVERSKQKLESELRQAAEIQRQCLPAQAPRIPGYDIAGSSAPCYTVGGDYFGFFPRSNRLCIVVADVAGKGMPASLLMMNLQARIQVLTQELSDPAQIAQRLNLSLIDVCPSNRFVTLFIAVLVPESGGISYCNMGHEPAFLIRSEGEVVELREGGPLAGVLPEACYEAGHSQMNDGDSLVIYSDGVNEAPNRSREQFGYERIAEEFLNRKGDSAEAMVDRINGAVEDWLDGLPGPDDVTVVGVIRENRGE